jgi:hypothetical protein
MPVIMMQMQQMMMVLVLNDCAGECGGSAEEDECGVCNGDGIADGACDCDGNVLDECGDCGGDGIDEGACDCDGSVEDCEGVCGGSTTEDDCGICGGDGSTCNYAILSLGNIDYDAGTVDINLESDVDVAGFQFVVSGLSLTGASGGSAGDAEFDVNTGVGGSTVLGFSFSGDTIPPGDGLLTSLSGEFTTADACLSGLVISVVGEGFQSITGNGECTATDYSPYSSLAISYSSEADIYGFQFNVAGVDLVDITGGDAGDNGFQVSFSSNTGNVIGFSMTGSFIPAGEGVLVEFQIEGDADVATLSDLIVSGPGGSSLDAVIDGTTIVYTAPILGCTDDSACNYNPRAT